MSSIDFISLLAQAGNRQQRITSFAVICLGIVELLTRGAISPSEGLRLFFHGNNCRYIREHFAHTEADEIMSHGVQLPDLFDTLPAEQAQQEFQRELATIRALCLRLLGDERAAA